jgi:hypothetical protein
MASDSTDDDPAFAVTVYSIMDRYRSMAVERQTACRALSAVTLALAPENLFDDQGEERLAAFFGERLDAYRDGSEPGAARRQVVRVIMAAAQADASVLAAYGLRR